MRALTDSNAKFKAVSIIRVDWDKFSDAPIVSELDIPMRSTLVMFNNGEEVGRVVAETSSSAIEALFESTL